MPWLNTSTQKFLRLMKSSMLRCAPSTASCVSGLRGRLAWERLGWEGIWWGKKRGARKRDHMSGCWRLGESWGKELMTMSLVLAAPNRCCSMCRMGCGLMLSDASCRSTYIRVTREGSYCPLDRQTGVCTAEASSCIARMWSTSLVATTVRMMQGWEVISNSLKDSRRPTICSMGRVQPEGGLERSSEGEAGSRESSNSWKVLRRRFSTRSGDLGFSSVLRSKRMCASVTKMDCPPVRMVELSPSKCPKELRSSWKSSPFLRHLFST
mmetsp:Transcript_26522/g.60010  ORF Transcript_26522/g.60010 Transcript_26522/m.60010 type:complete len:267 (-) Transcript_26522:161-961(-)